MRLTWTVRLTRAVRLCGEKMVRNVAGIVLTGCLCWWSAPLVAVHAQQQAAALEREEMAQELAAQAIAALRRGEEAHDEAAKIAAYREGLELARRAATADDSNADAHFAIFANLGRLMLLEGAAPNPLNLLKVERELKRCLELNPNHSDALAAQGGMYRQLPWLLGGSLDKAEAALKRSIEIDPNAVGARIELALVYRDRGQPERGVELLERAIVLAKQMNKQRQLHEAQRLLEEFGRADRAGDGTIDRVVK